MQRFPSMLKPSQKRFIKRVAKSESTTNRKVSEAEIVRRAINHFAQDIYGEVLK